MLVLGKEVLEGQRQRAEAAGEPAAEGQLRPAAAGPAHFLTLLLTNGQPQRECVCDQPGRDPERQHQTTDPTQSLEPERERKSQKPFSPGNLGYVTDSKCPMMGHLVVLAEGPKGRQPRSSALG